MAVDDLSARARPCLEMLDPVPGASHLIRYTGTRDELMAAGAATADMFPEPGRKRQ